MIHYDTFYEIMTRVALIILLCAASSPSPLALPAAIFFAYQPQCLCEFWNFVYDTYSIELIWFIWMPLLGITLYFSHGFVCLFFDSLYRPSVLDYYKIQKDKPGLNTGKIWKVLCDMYFFLYISCEIDSQRALVDCHKFIRQSWTCFDSLQRHCLLLVYR